MTINETDVIRRIVEYLESDENCFAADRVPEGVSFDECVPVRVESGWLVETKFILHDVRHEVGFVVSTDGSVIPFFGALGQLVKELGLPVCKERFLGSARYGRYQEYESGIGVWESFDDGVNFAVPVTKQSDFRSNSYACDAVVSFLDLRGSTNWSMNVDPRQIQEIVSEIEDQFQLGFNKQWAKQLFVKGTGDGLMIVSECDSYNRNAKCEQLRLKSDHVYDFCCSIASVVNGVRRSLFTNNLSSELAVGCSVAIGTVNRVFLLGRVDYLGPVINEAAKIQSLTYNEMILQQKAVDILSEERRVIFPQSSTQIPGKGLRVTTETFLDSGVSK